MKKLFYSLILALPFFTSCEEEDFGVKAADPQTWEQEAAITLPDLAISSTGTIDLAEAGDSVSIFAASLNGTMPEGGILDNFQVELATENFKSTLSASATGRVVAADLQQIIEEAYNKRPVERIFNATVYANIIVNGQASLVKGETVVTAVPVAPVIEEAYYLVGAPNSWNWGNGDYKFNHSGKDVYDDPVFTLTFAAPVDENGNRVDCWFKINPKSAFEAGAETSSTLGCETDGSTELEGKLIPKGDASCGAINMPASDGAEYYRITLNMMDYTYSISALVSEYFILGDNPFSWDVNTKKFMLYPQSKTTHSYTTLFKGNIKMINSNDMGTGNWNACYGTPVDGDTSVSAGLQQNAGAIHVPEEGYYTLTVDFKESTYTWTKCENQTPTEYTYISLIGDFNGWSDDVDLEQIAPHNWFVGNFAVENAGGLKFRAEHDWAINWGATLDVAKVNYGVGVAGGDNISVPAGTYNVFFNDITGEFVFQAI